MDSRARGTYIESRILSADPVELVRILYEAALDSVEKARRHLRRGEIVARSKEIGRASAILIELAISVNHDVDASLSRNLVELYDYMQRRLTEANVNQTEPPLADVSRLLTTLLEGWTACQHTLAASRAEAPEPGAGPLVEAPYASSEPGLECASRSWTL